MIAAVPVALSWQGIVLGTTYVGCISGILVWMLRLPEAGGAEQKVARSLREAASFVRILVPVQGEILSDKMVALACQMAKYRHAEITLVYVIEVPLTLPGEASMPGDEKQAASAFERATRIAERYGVKMDTEVLKTRQSGPGVVNFVRNGRYDMLLMGDVPHHARGGASFARMVDYVHVHPPCEVLTYRSPPDA